MIRCEATHAHAHGAPDATVTLDYDARMLRRKRLTTDAGEDFLVDLPATISLDEGAVFLLADGRQVEVRAAPEQVLEITGDLPRLAWHIGNRHTPCEVQPDRLLIREDHVLEAMLRQLGAHIHRVTAPFRPEGGAYGHGRTMGHDHGHSHDHGHHHDHPAEA
ncbi:urease accessory protein UreE [Mesobacterium pallidum]|uniref:urease accessory protein UreE n=1 Tax=Mesobacterium pallidum TaxID=2872037 RepID=UPI001EE1A14B|nr:urease accessory protein UreE [Mesobacterium pallidum]